MIKQCLNREVCASVQVYLSIYLRFVMVHLL